MGRRVIKERRVAQFEAHIGAHAISRVEIACQALEAMSPRQSCADSHDTRDIRPPRGIREVPAIGDLPSRLHVERSRREYGVSARTTLQNVHLLPPIVEQRN